MHHEDTSQNFLPHISERQIPDGESDLLMFQQPTSFADADGDPSTHPTVRPTFMERSRSEMKRSWSSYLLLSSVRDANRRSCYVLDGLAGSSLGGSSPGLRKSNSCSTIYLDDSTISQPNLKNTIKCITLAIYYHIANRKNRGRERLMEIFEESLHPISVNFFQVD